MTTKLQRIQKECTCPIFLDDVTRTLYATDASVYQVTPAGVAFPRTIEETAAVLEVTASAGIPIIPRGAGSGLAGGALGEGLIVDLARHNRFICDFDREARTVRVGAGVVLDQLNAFLKPYGLTFGPDVATSSRATLGGMIANDSSGARAPLYGTTIEHVRSLEVVLPDGNTAILSAESMDMREQLQNSYQRIAEERDEIERRFHRDIFKRWPGFGLNRFLSTLDAGKTNPGMLIGGSEGTLCAVYAATVSVVPLPAETGLALLFFDSMEEALQTSVTLLELAPASVEQIDDMLFNQTRGQRAFQAARDLLQLDENPCRAILLVEFYDNIADKLAAAIEKAPAVRYHICATEQEKALVWHLRKAGLSLLTGCPGSAKPTAGIEDAAVPPHQLPAYVDALRSVMKGLDLRASYYGHAASGLLHVRPVLDLHTAGDIRKFRELAGEVSALTRRFNGSLTAEHGVGIARTEYMKEHISPKLLEIMRGVKTAFDPLNAMNPGKIFDSGRWRIDRDLRQGAGASIPIPFEPVLEFEAKDHSFTGNLEQCNGCGGCRKEDITMCPTYQATGEELMSTRGRANIIRAVLEGRLGTAADSLQSEALEQALSTCLACKACEAECPSNVNMALLKAELLHARHRRYGTPFHARLLSRVDLLNALGSVAPHLANAAIKNRVFRSLLERVAGVAAQRPLPLYSPQRFDTWFRNRKVTEAPAPRGDVLLWDDCFVRHNEANIGRAAVAVLEAAGYRPYLVQGHACCGRPAFSMGRLDVVRNFGTRNLKVLRSSELPVIFLEPSCYAMFREEYIELGLDGAKEMAARAVLFEHFIEALLRREPDALPLKQSSRGIAIHAHCHAKALTDTRVMLELAARMAGNDATLLDSGCCGMAGAFGAMKEKYELSLEVAEALKSLLDPLPKDTCVIASGASCRHQITHITDRPVLHFAEVLAENIVSL